MAPVRSDLNDEVESKIKDVVQDLYSLMVSTANYDLAGRNSKDVLSKGVSNLQGSLEEVNNIATDPNLNLPSVPPELVKYVEGGRNPDIYTREFVELVRRTNQLMRGKMHAFSSFRDVLAEQMLSAMPELKEDVEKVLAATGGRGPGNGNEGFGPRPET